MVAVGLHHGGREPVPWGPRAWTMVAVSLIMGARPASQAHVSVVNACVSVDEGEGRRRSTRGGGWALPGVGSQGPVPFPPVVLPVGLASTMGVRGEARLLSLWYRAYTMVASG